MWARDRNDKDNDEVDEMPYEEEEELFVEEDDDEDIFMDDDDEASYEDGERITYGLPKE
jgi:hypothetical protein